MALGLGEGWSSEYSAIQAKINSGLNFGTGAVGIATNVAGYGGYAQSKPTRKKILQVSSIQLFPTIIYAVGNDIRFSAFFS